MDKSIAQQLVDLGLAEKMTPTKPRHVKTIVNAICPNCDSKAVRRIAWSTSVKHIWVCFSCEFRGSDKDFLGE